MSNEAGLSAKRGFAANDTFASYHPIVNMLYFVLVIGFSMWIMHPVCLGVSFVCAMAYSVYLKRGKAVKFGFLFILPMLIVTAAMNPLFNHAGRTIIEYLPDGNPLTLESIAYGIAAAAMLACVVSWFSCYNEVMTSDKFVYLFGRIIPALSLVLSMSLRFVPRFKAQMKVVSNAQRCIGRDASAGNIFQRARHGIRILSIMITWALENAIETADSMKSRGYGLKGRTAFSIFKFDRRDTYAFVFLVLCGVYIVLGKFFGGLYFRYFPSIKGMSMGAYAVSLYIAYFALGIMPLFINIREDIKWRSIRSRI